ncbi:NAD(P)-dependent oxidoreductase [Burkholderia gladioli]|uniref:NAD(P)-dependent oxidoreductase n=1 Tax=Burkholderia gladioli TaxID=28095 RepID=UPI00163FA672
MAHDSTQRPALLMTGPYQPWNDAWLSSAYEVHRLWEAPDRAAFLAGQGAAVRAIATRGDLGADAALERRAIAGAALDVFWNEPRVDARFLALPNVLLQPHHASGTIETRQAMGALVRDNLAAHFAGEPLLTPVA